MENIQINDDNLNTKIITNQIEEKITLEKFRQILIKNGIAKDYVITHEYTFEFKPNQITSIEGKIYIFKCL